MSEDSIAGRVIATRTAPMAPQQWGSPNWTWSIELTLASSDGLGQQRWSRARFSIDSMNRHVTWETVDWPMAKAAPTETWESPEASRRRAMAACFSTLRSRPSMFIRPDGGREIRSRWTKLQMKSKVFLEIWKKCLNASSSSEGTEGPVSLHVKRDIRSLF